MKVNEKKGVRYRIYLVAFFFIAALGVILARAYQLQVLQKEKLASLARAGYRGVVKLPPKRGIIYDRDGHELAASVEMGSIYVHPYLVEKKAQAARELAKALGMKESTVFDILQSDKPFVWLDRKTSPERIKQVKALGLEGVGVTTETRRYYPSKEVGAHVIGFAGDDNQGLEGLEKSYDKLLRGPEYTVIEMRDALGRPFYVSRPMPEDQEMHHLILTIDKDIQYKAQQALQAAVEETKAKGGHCIIVNPETGEILAMAVVPVFNPNVFWKHHPNEWRNRAIADVYEPGSAIKPFLLAAALDTGTLTPQSLLFCENGEYQVGNNTIHDHDRKGHGTLSVSEIITYSSNIGAVKIGEKLGYKRYVEYLKKFGFGVRTGIDLEGEREGYIRPPREATEIDKATSFFGQGITVSSIQLLMAFAAIANGGKLMRPYVVKAVKDANGRVVKENHPEVVRKIIAPETAKEVVQVLEMVVSQKGGTGTLAAISGYKVAGKTGTSQKVDPRTRRYSGKNYVTLFLGLVPVDKPKLAVLVMVDEPAMKKYGGLVAAPVFKEVATWSLNHLRINPDIMLAKGEDKAGQRNDKDSASSLHVELIQEGPNQLPDFSGLSMREVLRGGESLGLKVVLEGTGLAFKQVPQPGSSLSQVSEVKVSFRPPT
jgi:cell division protein FtsI (penicillin-binding protein 3)